MTTGKVRSKNLSRGFQFVIEQLIINQHPLGSLPHWRFGRMRIPISLMTVFTGVVDGVTAFEHSCWVLRLCRLECLGRGIMQAMSQCDPSLTVLID